MTELITALLTYGPLGIISGILLKMYMDEKKQVADLNKKIQELLEGHTSSLEEIYIAQNAREQQHNQVLKDYGQSVVDAVGQTSELAERIWSIRK